MNGFFYTLLSSLCISCEILMITYLYKSNPQIEFYEMLLYSYLGTVMFTSIFFLGTPSQRSTIKNTFKTYKKTIAYDVSISIIAVCCYFAGIALLGGAGNSVFERSGIIFSILIGYFLLQEKIRISDICVTGLMLIGFILYQDNLNIESILGIVITTFGVFLYTLISYIIKKGNFSDNILQYTFIRQCLILCIMSALIYVYINYKSISLHYLSYKEFILLSIASIFGGIFSRTFGIMALKKMQLHSYTLIKNSDLIFVLLGSYLLFGVKLSYINMIGITLIFIAIIIHIKNINIIPKKNYGYTNRQSKNKGI